MVCSSVSGKFSTDSLGSGLCCSGRFSLLSLILHSKSDTPGEGRLSLSVTLPELFLRKRKLIPLSLQVLLHQMKSLKETQIIKNPSCPCVFYNSFHSKVFPVLFCSDYKKRCLLYWDTTGSDNLLFQECVKYTVVWASWLINGFINRDKVLTTSRWKSAVDFHYENFSNK